MDEAECMDELAKWMQLNGFIAKGDRFTTMIAGLGWQLHDRDKQLQLKLSMAEAEVRRLKASLYSIRELTTSALA